MKSTPVRFSWHGCHDAGTHRRRRIRFTALLSLATVLLILPPTRAATTILHSFSDSSSDGREPYGSVTLSGSKLYGMTFAGGSGSVGTIFGMNTDGTGFGLLRSFTISPTDGRAPYGSLTLSGSTLYGMTYYRNATGGGTIFRMNTDGTGFGLLHSFSGLADGSYPNGSLTLSGSKLYGMTGSGGSSDLGALFSMNTDGTGFSLLHSFTGGASDGRNPNGSLTLSGSKLYGTTYQGGSSDAGTLFSINTDGSGFAVLHSLISASNEGNYPHASLTLSGSKLYGTASSGGSSGKGTLFSINTDGTGFALIHSFTGGTGDGATPYGSLTLSGSTLFGMTYAGGSTGGGMLFSLNADGTGYAPIHSLTGGASQGAAPYGNPTISADGAVLYGMTLAGGTANRGVVFSENIVPEPSTALLLAAGAGLLLRRRRGPPTPK